MTGVQTCALPILVAFGSADGNLYALNATTGDKLWSFATGTVVSSSAAVANGVVYNSSTPSRGSNQLYALNTSTGAKLWSFAIPPNLKSPVVANGALYVTGSDFASSNHLYAFSVGADLFLRIQPAPTPVSQGDLDRKSTRLNSSHRSLSRMPSSA